MATKLKHCSNCNQNVVPRLRTRQGVGCAVFLVCIVVGVVMGMVQVIGAGDDINPVAVGVMVWAWWLGGFVAMMVLGWRRYECPKCGLPRKQMGQAL